MNEAVTVCEDAEMIETIVKRLEEASETMVALRSRGTVPGSGSTFWPEVAFERSRDYAPVNTSVRLPAPSPERIARMDEAFSWLALIPDARLRRIVAARSLIDPWNGKYRWSYLAIGNGFKVSNHTAKKWHAQGLAIILAALLKKSPSSASNNLASI